MPSERYKLQLLLGLQIVINLGVMYRSYKAICSVIRMRVVNLGVLL